MYKIKRTKVSHKSIKIAILMRFMRKIGFQTIKGWENFRLQTVEWYPEFGNTKHEIFVFRVYRYKHDDSKSKHEKLKKLYIEFI